MIVEAILHTGWKTAEQIKAEAPELTDEEIVLTLKIDKVLDGEKALVATSLFGKDDFTFITLEDKGKDKETCYLMEQNQMVGAYIDNRKAFDAEYDKGEYAPDFAYVLPGYQVEVLKEAGAKHER